MAPIFSLAVLCTAVAQLVSAVPAGRVERAAAAKPSPTTSSVGSSNTLYPAIHWDHNLADMSNLVPQISSGVYYAEQPGKANKYGKHRFVAGAFNYTYPTVVTDHSEYITSVTCPKGLANPTQLRVTINNNEAWTIVRKSWASAHNLTLLTFTDQCSPSTDGQKTYWQTSSVKFTPLHVGGYVTAIAKKISTKQGFQGADLAWGKSIRGQERLLTV